jgi:alkylation response protein AidB-like acyl-CoA dehydrogenase
MEDKKVLQGGEFLIETTDFNDVFIPEEFNEEQRMMAETAHDFIYKEVRPVIDRLDEHEEGLLAKLMKQVGELGLLGVSIPEEYAGFGQNYVTAGLISEEISHGFSFSVAFSAHTGIATLPILYFGNEAQKEKYVTKLATGEFVGSYCLTEPGAGSDANAGKTKAVLSADGKHYILNGQKMWITNGSISDTHIVFAKIDDDKNLSAFIVESQWEGVLKGAEEHKMGIKGSSTTQIFYNDVKVPVENMLGERGAGFKMALYILNIGRAKLASASVGACKAVINESVRYTNERKQFGTLIANFPAIKYKLAQQAILTFATESATYRALQATEDSMQANAKKGMSKGEAALEGIRQYGIEASILKVFASESLDYIVDEAVQMYGGMGYSAETHVERAYRDSRINRIFEGTNEINRMVIVGELLKRAMKGEIDLMTPAMEVAQELMGIPDFGSGETDFYASKYDVLKRWKKLVLMVAGAAIQKYMDKLNDEQELLFNAADILINIYVAESALLRVQKLESMKGEEAVALYKDMLDVFFYDKSWENYKTGVDAVNSFAEGDEKMGMLMGVKRFTKTENVNVKDARRRIANRVIEMNKYPF